MGDRCNVRISFKSEEDANRFGEASGEDPDFWNEVEEDGRLFTVEVYECNYAWSDQLSAAAKAGVEFFGCHGEGGEYSAEDFVTCKGKVLYQETICCGSVIPFDVDKRGKVVVSSRNRKRAEAFHKAEVTLRKKWGIK